MHLLAPDILVEGQGLAPAISATGLILGLLVWLFGWRAHRFWIVMIATVAAGISGLYSGPRNGIPPLVASLLLAVAFGVLALALARVAAFVAGGVAMWMLAHGLLPQWDEPLLWVLAGGLLGLWMFRLWTMVVTSAAGTLLMGYSLLWLLEGFGKINAVDWAEQRRAFLDYSCIGVAAAGVLTQAVMERYRSRRKKDKEDEAKSAKEEAEAKVKSKKRSWFGFGPASSKRKAG